MVLKSSQINATFRFALILTNPTEKEGKTKYFGIVGTGEGEMNLSGPREILQLAETYMVVQAKKRRDWVWTLKGVVRPAGEKPFTAAYSMSPK